MKGMGNMGNMMKQMQKMQKKMAQAQEDLAGMTFTASVGGGMVTVTANGTKEITDVEIKEEVMDPDDIEMLQDLIIAATNEVLKQVDEKSNETMGQFTKGLNMPGGMF